MASKNSNKSTVNFLEPKPKKARKANFNENSTKVENLAKIQPNKIEVKASEVIRIRFVKSANEEESSELQKVSFTHQIFEDEVIQGISPGDIQITFTYTLRALFCLVDLQLSETLENKNQIESQISKQIEPVLPHGHIKYTNENLKAKIDEEKTFEVFGKEIHSYSLNGQNFVVRSVEKKDKVGAEFHKKAQKLAVWYIETADEIDLDDNRWEILYIWEKSATNGKTIEEAFIGYFTIFNFQNPIKGIGMRICQALILPQHQRKGHGFEMMRLVYKLAEERRNVFEVTVEDPAPGFQTLRDLTDTFLCMEKLVFSSELLKSGKMCPLEAEERGKIASRLKITKGQVEAAYEILLLDEIKLSEEKATKGYRLMVKRRLFSRNESRLSSDGEERKEELQEMFRQLVEERYRPVLQRMHRLRNISGSGS